MQNTVAQSPALENDTGAWKPLGTELFSVPLFSMCSALAWLLSRVAVSHYSTQTFTLRAFSRRFYAKRLTISTFVSRRRNNNIPLSVQ